MLPGEDVGKGCFLDNAREVKDDFHVRYCNTSLDHGNLRPGNRSQIIRALLLVSDPREFENFMWGVADLPQDSI